MIKKVSYFMELSEPLYRELKILSAKNDVSMTALIEDMMVLYFEDYQNIKFEKYSDKRRNFYKRI